jgi:hypothetical protein
MRALCEEFDALLAMIRASAADEPRQAALLESAARFAERLKTAADALPRPTDVAQGAGAEDGRSARFAERLAASVEVALRMSSESADGSVLFSRLGLEIRPEDRPSGFEGPGGLRRLLREAGWVTGEHSARPPSPRPPRPPPPSLTARAVLDVASRMASASAGGSVLMSHLGLAVPAEHRPRALRAPGGLARLLREAGWTVTQHAATP